MNSKRVMKKIRSDYVLDTKTQNYSKQSFDRFGDDLCELLLSYLPINNKIQFECISKQWQRLIYNKEKKLRITNIRNDDTINSLVNRNSNRFHSINIKAFECVLKKFQFINDIRIEGRIEFNYQMLDMITNNCNYLENISITARYIEDIPKKYLISFGLKCGEKLKSMKFDGIHDNKMKALLKLTPNLQSLTVDNISAIIDDKNELPLVLPKLESIHFWRCNLNALKLFSRYYSSSVKRIKTHLLTLDLSANDMNLGLIEFSHFEKLESLDLFVDVCHEESDIASIDEGLKRIANKCSQLKRLTFTMDGNIIKTQLFTIFGHFISLVSCEINIISDTELSDNSINSYNYGTITGFQRMKNLLNLSLHSESLSDEHFIGINVHLPQLKTLRINSSKTISDKTLHLLSHLKRLSKIDITSNTTDNNSNITDSGVSHIISNCLDIKTISFDQKNPNFDFNITKSSVQMIIERAKSKPNYIYNFSFAVNKSDDNNSKDNEENKFTNDLPLNLTIEII